MQKKFIALLLFCSLTATLCSCKKSDPIDLQSEAATSQELPQSTAEEPAPNETESSSVEEIALHNAGEFSYVNAGSGAYTIEQLYPNSSTISYIDYASGLKTPLCSTPGCSHQTDSCPSYIERTSHSSTRILWAGNYLLLVREAGSENAPGNIERRDPDGTNPVELCQFDASSYITGNYLYDGTSFYYTYIEMSSDGTQKKALEVMNLETGDRKTIIDLDDNTSIIGGFGNKVLIQDYDYNASEATFYLLDLNTLEKNICLTTNIQNEYIDVIDEGIVAVNQTEHLLRWLPISENGETDSEKQITLTFPETMTSAIPNKLFSGYVELDVPCNENGQAQVVNYIVDLEHETQTESTLVLGEHQILYPIVGEYEDKLCVVCDIEMRDYDVYSENGTTQTVQSAYNVYGMMKKDDFLNSVNSVETIA